MLKHTLCICTICWGFIFCSALSWGFVCVSNFRDLGFCCFANTPNASSWGFVFYNASSWGFIKFSTEFQHVFHNGFSSVNASLFLPFFTLHPGYKFCLFGRNVTYYGEYSTCMSRHNSHRDGRPGGCFSLIHSMRSLISPYTIASKSILCLLSITYAR